VTLRRAVPADIDLLRHWDEQPHVVESDPNDDWGWEVELGRSPDWREQLIAEVDGRPVGFLQILDPAREETHYWGDVPENLRAIDIWIGEEADVGKGHGTRMMQLALERCFADPAVSAVIIDPLASNTRAHRFYERLGFRPLERRSFGADDCLVHRLERADTKEVFMIDISSRRAAFARLHESGCFVIPNPWDIGTARFLAHLGFRALATTSAGYQFSRGQADTVWGSGRDEILAHIAEIVAATDLPVSADFQSGHAHDPEGVAANVALCVDTGVAGLSIEDATGDPSAPLYDVALAVERIEAARAAIDAKRVPVLLTARAESYLVGHEKPLADVLRRLTAYAEAGADVLFAPGPRTREDLVAIVKAVAPKPVNAIVTGNIGLDVADLAEIGVRRISVGSALARAAWGSFIRAARTIAEQGSFAGLDDAASFVELNDVFGR
jgi:2-methylisocitrate lyase-like PEP mutase family enzyme/RimJ/RimL family protein N-acetyltransferase